MPELTRPARELKAKYQDQNHKPQGWKQKEKNKPRPAKYCNWLTPFCWTQIIAVTKEVGWAMGASDITNQLKKGMESPLGR